MTKRNCPPKNNTDKRRKEAGSSDCKVSIHPLASNDGLIVRVVPPRQPVGGNLDHVSCDIVLVIDVSGSMKDPAPAPPSEKGESLEQTGLSVLDLTKHAANTIIETLNDRDRLAIVTFSTEAKASNFLLLNLVPMDAAHKQAARQVIENMQPGGTTNLLAGINLGLEQFANDRQGNARAMDLLTDGRPCGLGGPPDSYVQAMHRLGKLPATIHTFGFGYDLEPGLLQTIAECGGGNYYFIPDSSMLGTVFIHATANLQSTFAQEALLTLTYPPDLGLEEPGIYINKGKPKLVESGEEGGEREARMEYTISLHTIQYGQSRDIFLRYTCHPEVFAKAVADGETLLRVQATLQYQQEKQTYESSSSSIIRDDVTSLPSSEIAYHLSRAQVVDFLSQLFPIDRQGQHKPLKDECLPGYQDLQDLLKDLPANQAEHLQYPRNRALVEDLCGDDLVDGQVELALRSDGEQNHWAKWGRHFLPSLLGAHARQVRISFKDPGTQVYGTDSPLFLSQLEVLNGAFGRLRPPRPSLRAPPSYNQATGRSSPPPQPPLDMSVYNNSASTCFAGLTRVLLASTDGSISGEETIAIKELRAGMAVQTIRGPRTVRTVIQCHTNQETGRLVCILPPCDGQGLCVTPWHPVSLDGGRTWVYPAKVPSATCVLNYKGHVYAVQLHCDPNDNHADAHVIKVDGVWGTTMGHGLVEPGKEAQERDIRNHVFYGNYNAVAASLPKEKDGLALVMGVEKNSETGLAEAFIPFKKLGVL